MLECIEQYCLKFYEKLGETQSETICKIYQIFGIDSVELHKQKMVLQFWKGQNFSWQ